MYSVGFAGSETKEEPLVSIIVLNFNGRDILRDCLQSLSKTTYTNFEVLVVDNGSIDESRIMLEREFPDIQVLWNSWNVGYSKGNNMGIRCSKGDFVVLLNNDTVVQPTWLTELVRVAKRNPQCFYQPKILLTENKRINSAGNLINLFGFAFPRSLREMDSRKQYDDCEISYASGACVLASRRLIYSVGFLDEADLYTFYEDVNWGWRALMLGYKSIYVPSAVIYHRWGGSWGAELSSTKFYLIERGRLATLIRNYSSRTLVSMLPFTVFVEFSVLLYSLFNGLMSAKIAAYADILKNIPFLLNQKRVLQIERKNPDKVVLACFSNKFEHVYLGPLAKPANKVMRFISRLTRSAIR